MINISDISNSKPTSFIGKIEEDVFKTLDKLSISYQCVTNDIVEAMEECLEIDQALDCEVRKSILLTNKKRTTFFLVVLPANKSLDVKYFENKIGMSGLSFASGEDMERILGVSPGSLSALSVVHDLDDYVQVIIDQEVATCEYFACNTGTNQRHLKMKTEDLMRYLKAVHHRGKVMGFSS